MSIRRCGFVLVGLLSVFAAGASAQTLTFVDAAGPTGEVLENGTARLRLASAQDNTDPFTADHVAVQLQTQFAGDQELLTLTETGLNTGVFEGSIGLSLSPGFGGNGILETLRNGPPDFLPETITATVGPLTATAHTVASRVFFIDAFGRETASFPVGGAVGVRVVEPARNFDPQQRETTLIQLQVPGDQETVNLFETGFNTGIFEGVIGSERGGALANDGRLEGQVGQTIFATYQNVTTPNPTQAQAAFTGGQVLFVDAAGQPASIYLVGTKARVRVEDHGADVQAFAADTVIATVTTDVSGDIENLPLTETGPNTGVFEAEIQLRPGSALSGNGVLEVLENFGPPHEFDTLHASYTAAFNGGVSTAQAGTLSSRIWFIDAFGNVVTSYAQGSRVYVRIEDHQFNDPAAFDRAFAQVRSASGDVEALELNETGKTTGIFEGSLPLDSIGAPSQDGRLQARAGDEITATVGPFTATAHTVASRVFFIDGFGRATTSFPVGGPVGVRVVEPARNFDPQQRETTLIQLQVPGDQETVNLFETGFNTGVFEGVIGSDRGGAQPNDGRLEGQAGQTIFANYQNVSTPNPTLAQAVFTGGQVLFVDSAGQPASIYLVGTRARVRVEDHGADLQSFAVDTVVATVTSELSGDIENLSLTETGPNTGVFEAEIQIRPGSALSGNGVLEVLENFGPPHEFDTLHASYFAAANGGLSTAQAGTLNFRVWFIDAFGNVVTSYAQGSRAYVRIEDHQFNDPGAFDRVFAQVRSASGDLEFIELDETGKTTGIFEGSLPLDSTGTPAQDGRLQARPGDEITAERDAGFTAEPAKARIDSLSLGFIDESGRPTVEVLENGTARVRVVSPQDNVSPAADSVPVQLRTLYAGDQELLNLTETGVDTGVFEGSIQLSLGPGAGGNGTLETLRNGPPEFLPEEITATIGPFTATAHTVASRVFFIDGFGRETSSFPVGGPVGVRVVEPARNFDPQQRETTLIQLQVPGDQETVNLMETGINTGVFEGVIGSDRGGAQPNDGRLEGQAGQSIFASYQNVITPNPTLAQAAFTGGQVLFVDAAGQPASVYLVGEPGGAGVHDRLPQGLEGVLPRRPPELGARPRAVHDHGGPKGVHPGDLGGKPRDPVEDLRGRGDARLR
ncbi:MAG TPA: hypothetical protein VLV54_22560, partial [Thermoanaerobaculia bacterium]|nr:hypothetical protein [Thermoanaerobaculia bacterium]